MSAWVAAMTTWAQNKSKQHSFMQKSSSSLCYLTPDALYSQNPHLSCLNTSLKMLITCSKMLSICLEHRFNMLNTCSQHASNEHQ